LTLEPLDRGKLVGQREPAEVEFHLRLGAMTEVGGGTVVSGEHHEAPVRHALADQEEGSSPDIPHARRHIRAPVLVHDDRISPVGIEVRRQSQARIQSCASIGGRNAYEARLLESKRQARGRLNDGAPGIVQIDHGERRGRDDVGIRIQIRVRPWAHVDRMRAGAPRDRNRCSAAQ
jgi:hypothetical protein